MNRQLISLLLAGLALSQPGRAAAAEDEMQRLMADRGLAGRLDHMREQVRDHASELVVTALGFLGVPYRLGGNSAESGFDCSGFVRAMYQQTLGLVLPRRANEQAAATQVIDQQELRPGDLVFFNTLQRAFSHVGIYVGDGKFIHSPRPGAQVRVENMGVRYWASRFDGARRVIAGGSPVETVPAPAAVIPAALPARSMLDADPGLRGF